MAVISLIFSKLKSVLSGLIQFLATESPLKIMKRAFYFYLKTLFVRGIFKFMFSLIDHVRKQLNRKRLHKKK